MKQKHILISFLVASAGLVAVSVFTLVKPVWGHPFLDGWARVGTVVQLFTSTDTVGIGTTTPSEKVHIIGNLAISGTVDGFDISAKGINWDTAFNERLQWNGSSTSLDAALGRSSLGLGSLATLSSVSGGSGGTITDSTITNHDLATSTFPNIQGVGALNYVLLRDTNSSNCHKVTVSAAGTLSTAAVQCDGSPLPLQVTASEDFESYSNGDLNGGNGGTGWSGVWSGSTVYNVVSTPVYGGSRGGEALNPQDGNAILRSLSTSTTSGIFRIALRLSVNNWTPENTVVQFEDSSGNPEFNINVVGTKIQANGGGTDYDIVGTIVADTWYVIYVSYDIPGNAWKAKLDSDPSWGATVIGFGLASQIDRIRLFTNNNHTGSLYFDDIAFLEN